MSKWCPICEETRPHDYDYCGVCSEELLDAEPSREERLELRLKNALEEIKEKKKIIDNLQKQMETPMKQDASSMIKYDVLGKNKFCRHCGKPI